MDKVQKPGNSLCYTASSQPFRNYFNYSFYMRWKCKNYNYFSFNLPIWSGNNASLNIASLNIECAFCELFIVQLCTWRTKVSLCNRRRQSRIMKNFASWNPLKVTRPFGGSCHRHIQGQALLTMCFTLVSYLFFFFSFLGWGETEWATNLTLVPARDERWWAWSSRWNENWQSEKTCTSATWCTTNPTWIELGSNPGRSAGKPTTNRPSTWLTVRLWRWRWLVPLKRQVTFKWKNL
jgi:hypothetical protein